MADCPYCLAAEGHFPKCRLYPDKPKPGPDDPPAPKKDGQR